MHGSGISAVISDDDNPIDEELDEMQQSEHSRSTRGDSRATPLSNWSPSPERESSKALRKRSATNSVVQKQRPAKNAKSSELAETIAGFRKDLRESSEILAASLTPTIDRALDKFVEEVDELLGDELKVNGRVPFRTYKKVLNELQNEAQSRVYLSLLKRPKEDRTEWVLDILNTSE